MQYFRDGVIYSILTSSVCMRHNLLAEGWIVGGGDTCAGLASEGETGESPPREPGCMWRVWPSVAVSTRAANGLREISQWPAEVSYY